MIDFILQSLPSFLRCLDYWGERYQTAIVGAVALVGVWYSTRPAWKQLQLAQKERLAAKYRMNKALYDMFDPTVWFSFDGPKERWEADIDKAFIDECQDILAKKKSFLADLKARVEGSGADDDLRADALNTIDETMVRVRDADRVIVDAELGRIPKGNIHWHTVGEGIDMLGLPLFKKLQQKISDRQSSVVERIVRE
ncbi:hypothetical protein EFQ99_10265 [Rhizobium vallis]|uniref:Uncharacterized protein n=1 Tax=Rhizobium vallis TaxID=634290 RepID=A0A432PMY3_9HYPH|nr:hypothetical protein [Rhizobium vallis]RUM25157.1 hypothetical protein EFQ99_10265 [Rhizobium vallis]